MHAGVELLSANMQYLLRNLCCLQIRQNLIEDAVPQWCCICMFKIAFQKGRDVVSLVNSERFSVNSASFKQLMEQI